MGIFAVIGALLTLLGFGVGGGGWGLVVLAAFVVTLLCGLAVKFGAHRFVAGILLSTWFIIAIVLPVEYTLDRVSTHAWSQALAWLAGSALWIAFAGVVWLAGGRESRPAPFPEIPGDISPRKLTRPIVLFAVLRRSRLRSPSRSRSDSICRKPIGCRSPRSPRWRPASHNPRW